jgi:hypothetical protein
VAADDHCWPLLLGHVVLVGARRAAQGKTFVKLDVQPFPNVGHAGRSFLTDRTRPIRTPLVAEADLRLRTHRLRVNAPGTMRSPTSSTVPAAAAIIVTVAGPSRPRRCGDVGGGVQSGGERR